MGALLMPRPISIVVGAVVAAVSIGGVCAAPARVIGEAPTTNCALIVEAFDRGPSDAGARLIVINSSSWSMGYLTAYHENMGQQTTVDLLRDMTVEKLAAWITSDCRAHPDYVLLQVLRRLVVAITTQQTKSAR